MFDRLDRRQRIGGGMLFLFIALALLATRPIGDQLVLAGIALGNILISAAFFVTVGHGSAPERSDFVGRWALSVTTATFVYAFLSVALSGEIDVVRFMAFVVGFSVSLAFFSWLRDRYR